MTKTTLTLLPIAADTDLEVMRSNLLGETRDTRGALRAWILAKGDAATFFEADLGLEDKAGYLVHRDLLKAYLMAFSARQKALSQRMRVSGGDSQAQWKHAQGADMVTRLIEIRRAGKTWSSGKAAVAPTEIAA